MKRAVGYVRVSTDKQAINGVSLDLQDNKLEEYAHFVEHELVEIIHDDGISAKNIKDRPGMKRALAMLTTGQADHFIIYKLDRAFRNAREALEVADILQKRGIGFHSVTERFDTTSPSGRLFFTILAAMAEWERNIISERTASALQQKRATGQKTGGATPYGYTFKEVPRHGSKKPLRVLVPIPQEQRAIQRIHELRAMGYSYKRIAEALVKEGIFTRKGTPFRETQIIRILKAAA